MNVAIITPYHTEALPVLEACIASVRAQTVPADHFLIADGSPRDEIDGIAGVRHVRLDCEHHDSGGTPRMVGFLLAVAEEYEAIAFLDTDHRLSPDHVAVCTALAEADPEIDIVIARRKLLRPDRSTLPVKEREIDGGFADTNCHFVLPGAFSTIALWGASRKPVAEYSNGEIFLYNLASERLRTARPATPTVSTICRWESVYHHIGEAPPPEAQPRSPYPIWLLGDGRSGTTWLFELLNYHYRYRALFEPMNPGVAKQLDTVPLNLYLRPNDEHPELHKHLADVFSGRFYEFHRVHARSALFHRVLVKDIYAHLLSFWAYQRFPGLKIILLLRHPFAVAASKLNVQHWFPKSDPVLFLEQEKLRSDYLVKHEDAIRSLSRNSDFALNQVAVWSIINSVPLQQFSPEQIHVTFYEELMEHPLRELNRIFAFLDPDGGAPFVHVSQQIIEKPSSSTVRHEPNGPQQILPESRPEKWERVLTRQQIREGVKILERFGLAEVYNNDPTPFPSALDALQGEGAGRPRHVSA